MQSRHYAGAGGCRSPLCLCKLFPKPEQSPRVPATLSPCFPTPLPWCGLERKLGALRGASEWDLGRDGARPRLSLEFVASLTPGKFYKVPSSVCPGRLCRESRRRRARQSRRRQHRALCSLARSRGAARAPGGQALLPGRKPQLTQAARKAEATRPNCSGSTTAPTPGACLGTQAAHRGGGPGGGTPGGSEPRASPRPVPPPPVLPFSWHEVPRAVVCVWGPPDGQATRYIPQPPNSF